MSTPRHRGTSPARRGRDRRAVVIPSTPGARRLGDGNAPRVAVVGGGIAGLAAAAVLAERGVRVTLYEREGDLGGRLQGWPQRLADGSQVTMSRGFHAFFRQYYNLRGLLRRVDGSLSMLAPLPDYPLWHRDGQRDSFRGLPRTPPWNAAAFVARSGSFTMRDLARMRPRAALPLLDVRVPRVYAQLDTISAAEYLDTVGFPPAARHLAFEVFSRSFFADPRHFSAAELALMFHIYFLGSSEGLLFDVPDKPFPQALWNPLAAYLNGHGVRLRTATPVHAVQPTTGGYTVETGHDTEEADAVVLALDTAGLRTLVHHSPALGSPRWRGDIAALRTAPPFLVSRLWLEQPVAADRPAFLGTSGHPHLDNVSVLNRYESEAARWAARTGGSVVELHAYAVSDRDHARVQRRLVRQLHHVYPETRAARVIDQRHEWREDCPHFPPGSYAQRPTVHTPDPRVVLAGDLARTELPVALMERAATTGIQGANLLLARWGVRGQALWTVPHTGRWHTRRTAGALRDAQYSTSK